MYTPDDKRFIGADEPTQTTRLDGVTAAVIGGDGRELEYLRGLKADGAELRACGCLPEAEEIMGHPQTETAAEAVAGADIVLTTVVYITEDGYIYTPEWEGEIHQSAFEHIDPGATLYIGTSTDEIDSIADDVGFTVTEYGDDDELMLLRAPTIVEGALKIAIENTDISIHDSNSVVMGFGRMGFAMARALVPLGADTTVLARDRAQLARARELGAQPVLLEHKTNVLADAEIVFNTIPVELLDRETLEAMNKKPVIVDLSSVPGGTDFDAAEELGITAILARGLGGRAPKTAGRSQWQGIRRMILEAGDI
ncbi:MAG: dipicolinate synthase subunit DpsA [Halorubrum sp.]